jgi:RNA polymerase sigma-70 factor (ECF subfamily)
VTDQSQTELLQSALEGHIDSFGELCRRHYAPLAAVAYAVLADHQLAEDAAQEAFARALTRLESLKRPEKFAPWLAAICRNIARDMLAAKARQVNIANLSSLPNPDKDDRDERLVKKAVAQLPESEKELIVLKYYDGFSYEQISAVLDISKPAINGRLTRAKKKLAAHLKRMGLLESQS